MAVEVELVIKSIFQGDPNGGTCFGTLDPSRLRDYQNSSNYTFNNSDSDIDSFNPSNEFQWYWQTIKPNSTVDYFCKDMVILGGTQARLITSVNGDKQAISKFLENKLTYHDKETGKKYYVERIFR